MNFLAHLYLSQNQTNVMIGNFIADHIKGKAFENYNKEIQLGIWLHRAIDEFTDTHPIVKQSKERLDAIYRHYDGVIIDIFYDHFLAKNWEKYHPTKLNDFVQQMNTLFFQISSELPLKTQRFITYMIEYNMLYNYQFLPSIERVLIGMNQRSKGKSHMHLAINDLQKNYIDFEKDFTLFFTDLIQFSAIKYKELSDNQ